MRQQFPGAYCCWCGSRNDLGSEFPFIAVLDKRNAEGAGRLCQVCCPRHEVLWRLVQGPHHNCIFQWEGEEYDRISKERQKDGAKVSDSPDYTQPAEDVKD